MTDRTEILDETVDQVPATPVLSGAIKWFDPKKGFGFVVADKGGPDILLHVNVLLNFGQSSIAENTRIDFFTTTTSKGSQVDRVTAVYPPESSRTSTLANMDDASDWDVDAFADVPLEPARVKWFDKGKGFGFANVFGKRDDVFVHINVLQQSGLSDLQPGEALAIRVIEGERGKMAAKVQTWDSCSNISVHSRRVPDLLCVNNLVNASPAKEHDDNEDFQLCVGRAANWLKTA